MGRGILILGLNGCGKTTVGRMLAARLQLFRMDAEDYYFPFPGDYSITRSEEEVHQQMLADARSHGDFVLSCVRCNIPEALVQLVELTVVLRTTPELRAQRIIEREIRRFSDRVLPGGDMYEAQQNFHAFAAARSEELVTQTLPRLNGPVLEMDAALPVEEIVERICRVCESAVPEEA